MHAALLQPPPGDAESLAVWADELLERGDAVGEFFQLQFKAQRARLTPREASRMRGLQREHLKRLLGPLYRVLTNVRFRGGRPVGASLANNPRGLRRTRDNPAWGQLESLDLGPRQSIAVQRHPERLLARCPHLTALWNLDRLPEGWTFPGIVEASVRGAPVAQCLTTFPNLERLEVKVLDALPRLVDPPHLRRLERLTFSVGDETQLTWAEGRWRLELGRSRSSDLERAWFDLAVELDAEISSRFGLEPPSWDPPPSPPSLDDLFLRCGGLVGDDEAPF